MRRPIRLLRFRNMLAILGPGSPGSRLATPMALREPLEEALGFFAHDRLPGRRVRFHTHWMKLHKFDDGGICQCDLGMRERVEKVCRDYGFETVRVEMDRRTELEKAQHAERMRFHWDRLKDLKPRPDQLQLLKMIEKYPNGRYQWPTGTGKSWIVGALAFILPYARIDVVTASIPALHNLYREVKERVPSVGFIGGGQNSQSRVNCASVASLHKLAFDSDVLLGDESHQLCSDWRAAKLAPYAGTYCKKIGLSANQEHRSDGRDLQQEAIFGPIRAVQTYQEAVEIGSVSQLHVIWKRIGGHNLIEGLDDSVARKRYGIWRNQLRNHHIAQDALSYTDDQVLVSVATVEHAVILWQLLPDFTLVYAPSKDYGRLFARLRNKGLIERCPPPMTVDRLLKCQRLFERGTIRKAIATTVWNVGVNFKQLSVLCRAEGGRSAIAATQVPGRLSRRHDDKQYAILHEYWDAFDKGMKNDSSFRRSIYRTYGWKESFPTAKRST